MSERQLNLNTEPGWPPEVVDALEGKPELELAWRGVVISIKSDQITKEAAYAMLRRWEELEPLPDQHDAGPNGNLAA